MNKKTILWYSHGITINTGFGKVGRMICKHFVEKGHNVYAVHQQYHGVPLNKEMLKDELGWQIKNNSNGVNILPHGASQWGEDVLPFYITKYKPDYVMTLLDIWCGQHIATYPRFHPWKWIGYFPFDTENVVSFWLQNLANMDIPVAMSKFGYKLMTDNGIEGFYIPHGVDTNIYKPATNDEKLKLREFYGLSENDFIILCVSHNQMRKKIDRLLSAFQIFGQNKPNVKLLLHMSPRDQVGWDIPLIIKDKGLTGKVLFSDRATKVVGDSHIDEKEMRNLYCIADCHALLTGGEGFGIPFIEAMSCGLPNIATAFTTPKEFFGEEIINEKSEKELKSERGLLVPIVDIEHHHTGGFWGLANVKIAAEAMEFLYQNPDKSREIGMKARKFVVENYDWETKVLPQWDDLLEKAESIRSLNKRTDDKTKFVMVD